MGWFFSPSQRNIFPVQVTASLRSAFLDLIYYCYENSNHYYYYYYYYYIIAITTTLLLLYYFVAVSEMWVSSEWEYISLTATKSFFSVESHGLYTHSPLTWQKVCNLLVCCFSFCCCLFFIFFLVISNLKLFWQTLVWCSVLSEFIELSAISVGLAVHCILCVY